MPVAVRKAANRWRPNEEAGSCSGCARAFSLLVRRHHCRQCGDIFCADCSDRRRIVPIVHPTEPQRVCQKCYRYVAEASSGLRNNSIRISNTSPLPHQQETGSNPSNSHLSDEAHHNHLDGTTGGYVRKGSAFAADTSRGAETVGRKVPHPTPSNPNASNGSLTAVQTALSPPGQRSAPRSLNPSQTPSASGVPRPGGSPASANSLVHPHCLVTPANGSVTLDTPHQLAADTAQESQSRSHSPEAMEESHGVADFVEDDDGDEFGLTGTPPSIAPSMREAGGNGSMAAGAALSFMAALEDATRGRQLTLPVLLYVREGHELPIVVPVESSDETVGMMIARLTSKFFELSHVRKKAKTADLDELRGRLSFVNELGVPIPNDTACSTLSRRGERVILATTDTIVSYQRSHSRNSGSNRSLHSGFFHRSERSEPGNDVPQFDDDDVE